MKTAVKLNSPVVKFTMLQKVILTFESVDEIIRCNHSNESYHEVFPCGSTYFDVQIVAEF